MTEEELAWIAGFYEGEGCVSLTPNLRPRISIVQKDQEPLEWIQSRFGGRIYLTGRTRTPTLVISRRALVKDFLETILPYMRLEKRIAKAELAIELTNTITTRVRRESTANRFKMV